MSTRKTPPKAVHTPAPIVSHVVGDAAAAGAGTGTDTQASSDWMAEMKQRPGAAAAPGSPPGVAVSTRPRDASRGRAVESKRGQR